MRMQTDTTIWKTDSIHYNPVILFQSLYPKELHILSEEISKKFTAHTAGNSQKLKIIQVNVHQQKNE